jgi:Raf kinase inhibitor-like YbhB/YbcL family protein
MAMSLNSPAFKQNGHIPSKYTCEGEDVSPPLAWEGVPNGAKSLVLIIGDPDAPDPKAPKMVWVHWVDVIRRPEVLAQRCALIQLNMRVGSAKTVKKGIPELKSAGLITDTASGEPTLTDKGNKTSA